MEVTKIIFVLPNRKYYGTPIELEFDNGESSTVEVWLNDPYNPSERQLREWNITKDHPEFGEYISDGHYESQLSYDVAKAMLNGILSRWPRAEVVFK